MQASTLALITLTMVYLNFFAEYPSFAPPIPSHKDNTPTPLLPSSQIFWAGWFIFAPSAQFTRRQN